MPGFVMDRLRAMEVFAEVVGQRSFSAAARHLRLPRGVVSKHVQKLEALYGTRLLNRTTRRVSLTETGARLYEHCRSILSATHEFERELDENRGAPQGRLRVTAPVSFTLIHLGPMIEKFLRRHPQITLDLECSDLFVDIVKEGFDVGVRIGELPPSSLVARKLALSKLVICASPEYLKRYGRPRTLADLSGHKCLGYTYQSNGEGWSFKTPSGTTTLRTTPTHRINNDSMLKELVLKGHGLVQLPSFMVAREIAAGKIVTVLDKYADTSRSVYVVYPHRRHLAAKVRAFVEFLAQAFKDGAPWNSR